MNDDLMVLAREMAQEMVELGRALADEFAKGQVVEYAAVALFAMEWLTDRGWVKT